MTLAQEPPPDALPPLSDSGAIPWHRARWSALTRPTLANYQRLLQNPNATQGRAYLWVVITTLLSFICVFPVMNALVTRALIALGWITSAESLDVAAQNASVQSVSFCLTIPAFLMEMALAHAISTALGGKGEYGRFVYVVAAFVAPASLIVAFLQPLPLIGYATFLITLITFAFSVVAIQAAYQVGWVKSVVARLGGLLVVAMVTLCILTLLGPALETSFKNAFKNTVREIQSTSQP